ncbi:MAG TPA: PaaI family thioesterase [Bacillota bacterium]
MQLEIDDLTEEERALLAHTLAAIRKTRSQGLHFFANFLGFEWEPAPPGRSRVCMPVGPQVRNTRGAVQGGAVATLADLTLAAAVRSALSPEVRLVTVEMRVHYLRPGRGPRLVGEGECVYAGRRFGVAEARISADDGELVALATGTFAVVRPLHAAERDPGEPGSGSAGAS